MECLKNIINGKALKVFDLDTEFSLQKKEI